MNAFTKYTKLLAMMVVLVMLLSACGDNDTTEQPVVVPEDTTVQETPVVVETEVETDQEVEVTREVETEVETDVIVDTEVITETEVFTETDITEVITETEVITDVQVMTDTETIQDTDVETETAQVDTSQAVVLILFTDAAGSRFLADQDGQPIFAYTGTEIDVEISQDFEPIEVTEDVVIGEGLDEAMFSQEQRGNISQLTYNDNLLYRFVGTGDAVELAAEQQLAPLTVDE